VSPGRFLKPNLSNTLKPKRLIKDIKSEHIDMLGGKLQASLQLRNFEDDDRDKEKPIYTYEQHRVALRKGGLSQFENWVPPKNDTETGEKKIEEPIKKEEPPQKPPG